VEIVRAVMEDQAVRPEDKLSTEAILVLVGAIVHIVGRYLMIGSKGLVVAGAGFFVVWCGVVLYYVRGRRKGVMQNDRIPPQ
jgi:hypothetical protein